MFKKIGHIIIFLFLIYPAIAQNSPSYNKYYNHLLILNPSDAGVNKFPIICSEFEKQWLGIPNSPNTQIISISGRIGTFNFYNPKKFLNKTKYKGLGRVGLGLAFFNDKSGPIRNQAVHATYSYHIPVAYKSTLSFGISGVFDRYNFFINELKPRDDGDELLINNDTHSSFDANFGMLISNDDFSIGFAVNELTESANKVQKLYKNNNKRDFLLHGEYIYPINSNYAFEPAAVLKYYNQTFKTDLHARIKYRRYHWLSVSFFNYEQVKIMIAFKVRKIHIGYSYTQFLSKMTGNSFGTHGVSLGYNLGMRSYTGKREEIKIDTRR